MSNLLLRIMTSILLLPVVIYAFWTQGPFLVALLALVSLFCSIEISGMVKPKNNFFLFMAILFWAGLFGPLVFTTSLINSLACISVVLLISNSIILFNSKINQQYLEKLTTIFYFIFYVIIGISCLYWLAHEYLSLVFLAFVATWGNDTCAYFGGRAFGKRPLFKRVSAKKTWEGFISGSLGSLLIIFALYYFIPRGAFHPFWGLTITDLLWVTLPAIILAPLGDLIESRLKRIYDTKDASNILPGHGGLLDRIDALLLVIPWTAVYAFFIRVL